MPINRQYPLPLVLKACVDYATLKGEKIVACYLLLKGYNDTKEHAMALAEMLPPEHFDLQLLTFNPIKESGFKRSECVSQFKGWMESFSDLLVDVRISKGQEVEGGCGQLVQSYAGKSIGR